MDRLRFYLEERLPIKYYIKETFNIAKNPKYDLYEL